MKNVRINYTLSGEEGKELESFKVAIKNDSVMAVKVFDEMYEVDNVKVKITDLNSFNTVNDKFLNVIEDLEDISLDLSNYNKCSLKDLDMYIGKLSIALETAIRELKEVK